MSFRDLLADTLHDLAAHKRRTALTMFGITWGIISITLMVAAGQGLGVGFERKKAEFGRDILIVFAGRTSLQAGGTRAGRSLNWRATDHLQVQRDSPSCRHVMPELGQDDVPVRSSHNSASLLVTGSLPPFAEIRSIGVAEGRYPNWEDEALARRVALLGSEAKRQLFASRPAVGETIRIGDYPYAVVGVARAKEEDSNYDGPDMGKIFLPIGALLRDLPKRPPLSADVVDRLLVTPRSLEEHEACKAEVRRALARLHQFDPRDKEAAGIWDTVEQAKAFRRLTDGMQVFLGAVGVATLFIGAIGVMNVMLVAVRERTREIGVRRALGATRRSIVRLFFVETLIVVFASGGIGLAVAYGICVLFNLLFQMPYFAGLLPTWWSALFSFLLLSAVALFAAIYPARRAAAVDPIEALRFEAGG
jgi:putative ABC transport system permease protein